MRPKPQLRLPLDVPPPPALPHWHVLAHRPLRGHAAPLPHRYASPAAAWAAAGRLERRQTGKAGLPTHYTISDRCERAHAPA